MTSPAQLLAVVLLALLVGATIPVLYQAFRVLGRVRLLLDSAAPRLENALDQVGRAAERLDGIGSSLEAQARTLKPLFSAVSTLGQAIGRSREWLRTALSVGGAVGPAMIAGVRALLSGPDDLGRPRPGLKPRSERTVQSRRHSDRGAMQDARNAPARRL